MEELLREPCTCTPGRQCGVCQAWDIAHHIRTSSNSGRKPAGTPLQHCARHRHYQRTCRACCGAMRAYRTQKKTPTAPTTATAPTPTTPTPTP